MLSERALLVQVDARVCAIPLHFAIEIMRSLPVDAMNGMPSCMRGLSVIRGQPTPVVDLSRVLGAKTFAADGYFVSLRVASRCIALAVENVCGIYELEKCQLSELPPLLQNAGSEFIEAIGNLDSQFMVVLNAARIVPDDVWTALAAYEVAQ